MKKPKIGQAVLVYDRYRFSIPLRAVITELSKTNDGVEVKLSQSNNQQWPINSRTWVSRRQLRKIK